jgi:hypothetical protein
MKDNKDEQKSTEDGKGIFIDTYTKIRNHINSIKQNKIFDRAKKTARVRDVLK